MPWYPSNSLLYSLIISSTSPKSICRTEYSSLKPCSSLPYLSCSISSSNYSILPINFSLVLVKVWTIFCNSAFLNISTSVSELPSSNKLFTSSNASPYSGSWYYILIPSDLLFQFLNYIEFQSISSKTFSFPPLSPAMFLLPFFPE